MYRVAIAAIVAAVCLSGCKDPARQNLNGTGSTFVQPVMKKWAEEYQKSKGQPLHYEPVGSSAGVRRLATGLFDFACTDAALDAGQRSAAAKKGEVLYIPLVLGAVVPAYNLPDITEPVTLSGPVLAEIFRGKITNWNDDALRELNRGITLPDMPIAVLHRSEGSGTTYIWTDYLAKVSPEWKDKPGVGMTVKWPLGKGRPGNAGVADSIKKTPGALGYVQFDYALREGLGVAQVKNRSGATVKASAASVTAAVKSSLADIPADLRFSATDADGADAYPIAGAVWAIVYVNQPAGRGKPLADFLRWDTHEGQDFVEELHYARLPSELVERIDKKLDQIAAGP